MSEPAPLERSDQAIATFHELLAGGSPLNDALAQSVIAFPDQADLLTECALFAEDCLVPTDTSRQIPSPIDAKIISSAARFKPRPLSSLRLSLKESGIDLQAVLPRLRIGKTVFAKLERRLIDVTTIPGELVTTIADLVGEPADRIASYLSLPPTLSYNSGHNSATTPAVGLQQSFEVALRTSVKEDSLPDEDLDYWISRLVSSARDKG